MAEHKFLAFKIQFDGGANPNPGPAGIGYFIDMHSNVMETQRVATATHFIGNATNNQAEAEALARSLQDVQRVISEVRRGPRLMMYPTF